LGLVEVGLFPHVVPRLEHPAAFIVGVPLSERIQQVPVVFAANTLDQSGGGILGYGLIGAALLAAIVIALLVIGASERELRGVAVAALLAAAVLGVPLLLALVGHDDYIARGLMPGWIPLAIVVAAACTAARARIAGAALAVALGALFVYAGIKIDSDHQFQRPDWRGVAAALGRSASTRAIVAYDGQFAAGPLSIYLPGIPWSGPGMARQSDAPVTVSEVDVVGNREQQLQSPLPAGTTLIASPTVDGSLRVVRIALRAPRALSPSAIAQLAETVFGPGPSGASVMIQRPST
jgi:hypothetical protein